MRTTLDIDDDLLAAAKEMARRERSSAGQVISRLVRQSLTGEDKSHTAAGKARRRVVAGFRPFPPREGVIVSNDQVNALRDSEGV